MVQERVRRPHEDFRLQHSQNEPETEGFCDISATGCSKPFAAPNGTLPVQETIRYWIPTCRAGRGL
jgi:hypothetical protein